MTETIVMRFKRTDSELQIFLHKIS